MIGQEKVEEVVRRYFDEAKKLLPDLPGELSVVWDSNLIIPGNGTGGTLVEPTLLGIGYDPNFEDSELLSKNLRATVLHECFHAAQGWSDKKPLITPKSLLEDGILEGSATVFEREFGHTSPPWASYENDETMLLWLDEIKLQKLDPNSDTYKDYKFGTVSGVSWMLYKLGTWIVDKALLNNPGLTVTELAKKKPIEIIELAGL